jgi:NAD-dependent dihydropyrimidine dehydrogenase PreA subunit
MMMGGNRITVNDETCKKCGLCSEVCPNKIIKKNDSGEISFRQDRIRFCFKCGQCMAICPTESIYVEGLSYSKDFVDIPESESFEKSFFNMMLTRRAVRNFKDKKAENNFFQSPMADKRSGRYGETNADG